MRRQGGLQRVLIVDGYNVINTRRHLGDSAALADARDTLIRELQDYAGFSGQKIVVVFDAWQGDRENRSVEKHGAVEVVFTQKRETADHYIERLCDEYAEDIEYRRKEVRVATSDALEQTIVLGRGATRMSSRELLMEMRQVRDHGVQGMQLKQVVSKRTTVAESIPVEVLEKMRRIGRGE